MFLEKNRQRPANAGLWQLRDTSIIKIQESRQLVFLCSIVPLFHKKNVLIRLNLV